MQKVEGSNPFSRFRDTPCGAFPFGALAEWLRSGLQSRLHRFDSGRRLSAGVPERCGLKSEADGRLPAPLSLWIFPVYLTVKSVYIPAL